MGLLLATFAGLGVVLGGLLLTVHRDWSAYLLRFFVAIGAGFLLAVAFLRMLPEAMDREPQWTLPLVLTGYFLTHLFEHALVPHFHFGEETHLDIVHGRSSLSAVAGLGIHSFFDGVSIGAGYTVSPVLGWLVFMAIALHKLPEGFTIASIVRAAGGSPRQALGAAAIVGVACLAGAGALAGRPEWAGAGLALACGVTIYVAATDLIPEVNKEVGHHLAFTVLAGLALFLVADWALHRLAGP
ncbi:MAG TPA: ZIP family metal transporter [Gemmatimonadota bacterium]|nr:ZIP family metal transporter [Gemmatimonadota bacterium]